MFWKFQVKCWSIYKTCKWQKLKMAIYVWFHPRSKIQVTIVTLFVIFSCKCHLTWPWPTVEMITASLSWPGTTMEMITAFCLWPWPTVEMINAFLSITLTYRGNDHCFPLLTLKLFHWTNFDFRDTQLVHQKSNFFNLRRNLTTEWLILWMFFFVKRKKKIATDYISSILQYSIYSARCIHDALFKSYIKY